MAIKAEMEQLRIKERETTESIVSPSYTGTQANFWLALSGQCGPPACSPASGGLLVRRCFEHGAAHPSSALQIPESQSYNDRSEGQQ
jgi:hypothetical protein